MTAHRSGITTLESTEFRGSRASCALNGEWKCRRYGGSSAWIERAAVGFQSVGQVGRRVGPSAEVLVPRTLHLPQRQSL